MRGRRIIPKKQVIAQSLKLLTLASCLICLSNGLQAQEKTELFEGSWAVGSKTVEPLIILLKPGGNAAFFYAQGSDNSIYPGTWTVDAGTAKITWENGTLHELRQGAFDFVGKYTDSLGSVKGDLTAQKVPSEALGQWAVAPDSGSKEVKVNTKTNYFGIWKYFDPASDVHSFLLIEDNRSAAKFEPTNETNSVNGSWVRQGSELHLIWENGDYSILRETERGFAFREIEAGQEIEIQTNAFQTIQRVPEEQAPSSWLSEIRNQQSETPEGYVFTSRKAARDFYRGYWLIEHASGSYERLKFYRYGTLETSRQNGLDGDWMLSGQDAMLRWDDGMRYVLSPVGQGFVLFSYKPGRAIDGVPTRTLPAAPQNPEKLEILLAGRSAFAKEILSRAQNAGIDTQREDSKGPLKWIWPFGETNRNDSAALMVHAEEPISKKSTDPWWWPLWSEAPSETEEAQATKNSSTHSSTDAQKNIQSPQKPLIKKNSDWYWPF